VSPFVQTRAIGRLDLAEVLRSRWVWFCVAAYALLGGVLVTLGVRESSILGFTGTSRVLLSFSHALILLLPLLALMATAPVVQRARDDGTLELLFSQPLSPGAWFAAVLAVRYLALLVPLALVLGGLALWGQLAHGDPIPWPFLGKSLLVSAALLWAFCGIGLAISVAVRSAARVITYLVVTWAVSVALLDFALIGLALRWRLDAQAVFVLAIANPVESARLALLSSLEPDLAAFGPVGFYMANRLGAGALLLVGVAWPALVGTAAALGAYLGFRRSDRI
jgi:ABC-2 type transport system permease protein